MVRTKKKDTSIYGSRLILAALLLAISGIIMILSATSISALAENLSSFAYVRKQTVRVLLGVVVMLAASRVDYHRIRPLSFFALLAITVYPVICLLPGSKSLAPVIGGARRLVHLGWFSFQPSELAKFFLICWSAGYLVRKKDVIRNFSQGFIPFVIVVGIFFLLVLRQPDLSMAAVILALVFLTGFIGGVRPTHLIMLALLLLPLMTYMYVMKVDYRSERLTSFFEGEADKSGVGYQAYQSKLALGSGGISGVGLGQSRQKFFFLPAAHTDFIFAILGEELGFLGTTVVVGTFCWLSFLGVKIARGSPDYYGFLLASGLTLMIFTTAILNMAVASGLAPTTGLPLPFFSYGGTNLVTTFWAVGILDNISRRSSEPANG